MISKGVLNTYIAVLVIAVGTILLINLRLRFNMWIMTSLGVDSAFNKGICGAGFGPLLTDGLILSGYKSKRAVGVATFTEVPVCIAGFLGWILTSVIKGCGSNGISATSGEIIRVIFSDDILCWDLILALFLGVVIAAPIGPYLTKRIGYRSLNYLLGSLIIIIGLWLLAKVFLPLFSGLSNIPAWLSFRINEVWLKRAFGIALMRAGIIHLIINACPTPTFCSRTLFSGIISLKGSRLKRFSLSRPQSM